MKTYLKLDPDFPDQVLIHHVFPLPVGKGFQDTSSASTILAKVLKMDGIMQARKILNSRRSEKVSVNSFLLKFVAEAIKNIR